MIATALCQTGPFRDVEPGVIAGIARDAAERVLAPGETLFQQGEPASRFFLVVAGRLKGTTIAPDGKQAVVRLIHPGDLCGLVPALMRPDHSTTCRALVAARLLAWPANCWESLLTEHPAFAVGLTRALGQQIAEAQIRIAELITENVERRVANAVLRLTRNAAIPVEGGLRIDFPVTRQDLAELTGTTLHGVSRIVSAWGARGIVGRGRASLMVRDLPALERVARGEG